jgi:anti-sigma factor RsiW
VSAAPSCDRVLLVQAEFDGELDAAQAAALAAHRADCAICQTTAAELARTRRLLGGGLYQPISGAARGRLMARLSAAQPATPKTTISRLAPRLFSWWRLAASFGVGAACATAVALLVLSPAEQSLTGQIVAAHIRALQPGHLDDVASSNQHTVKPWFDGRIDFAPPVRDLAAAGYPLIGGRLDYLDGRPVAALVYRHDKHIIDLFVWPSAGASTAPETAQRQGYNVVHWSESGMTFWAVSDLEPGLLRRFSEEWRATREPAPAHR